MKTRRTHARDPVTNAVVRLRIWDCPHVAADFPRDLPPPWGCGYDDEFPPSQDPCWDALAAPFAEDIPGCLAVWAKARAQVTGREKVLRWLQQASAWLELRGYVEIEGQTVTLTETGAAWLHRRSWEHGEG